MENTVILIVDDERDIRNILSVYLLNEGYRILEATNGREALDLLEQERIDLVILDVMMPEMDGIETCLKIRQTYQMPIIVVSAKGQDMDKILGLSSGADDYVAKPFNPLEVVARVKSQLRRYLKFHNPEKQSNSTISIGDLVIDVATHEVFERDRKVSLTPREFAILELLARNGGIVLSTETIYEKVWHEPFLQSENTVMVHIRNLREKIEENPRRPQYIKTVWGVGYKLEK